MNPKTDPIYAGIAGFKIDVDRFDLGRGITICQTYGQFIMPFLIAFSPAKRGGPPPAPWTPVYGGDAINFHVLLHVPETFEIKEFFDRLNTVWWITALMRLRGSYQAHVPVLAAKPFAAICSPAWGAAAPRKDENGSGGLAGRAVAPEGNPFCSLAGTTTLTRNC
jgi:hypothetical protein